MSKDLYLGIDMGGTQIKVAVVTSKGVIEEETVMFTDINENPSKVLSSVVYLASKLKNYPKIKSIGVGIAGDIDSKRGIVRFSPNLPKWKNVQLKKMLEKLTNKKTFVDNDANTAAVGAFWLDVKGKSQNLICITLGTGVGGGLIFNKKLYVGASGTAGEVGHITIDPYGRNCNCGNRGCIETFVGAKYLSEYASKYLKKNKSQILDKLTGKKYAQVTPQVLSKAALLGDKSANEIWDRVGEKLGIFLSIIINFANPDTVVLCGGLSHAARYFLPHARSEMKGRAFKSAQKACKIMVSKYTHKLGVVGAAMLPKH
ncbi:MAG: ROK family protein [Endomicrobium sp.]|jgi:glucokinase|nr:ROK family protein [Endomicrobium sp.]